MCLSPTCLPLIFEDHKQYIGQKVLKCRICAWHIICGYNIKLRSQGQNSNVFCDSLQYITCSPQRKQVSTCHIEKKTCILTKKNDIDIN